jgi:hypothetical protein
LNKRLIVIAVALLAVVGLGVTTLRGRKPPGPPAVRPDADAGVKTFSVNEWLDSCLGACRRSAPRRLGHLSVEKRQRFCDVNCECGMEKMTQPGPKAGQLQSPSAAWMKMTEEQQMQAAEDCQKRSNTAVAGNQPPDGAP